MAETLKDKEGSNLPESGLQEHIAHWAEVLDHWVQSIDVRLGRHDVGVQAPPLDGADGGQEAEQSSKGVRLEGLGLTDASDGTTG